MQKIDNFVISLKITMRYNEKRRITRICIICAKNKIILLQLKLDLLSLLDNDDHIMILCSRLNGFLFCYPVNRIMRLSLYRTCSGVSVTSAVHVEHLSECSSFSWCIL
jgi:hypothetical protein